MFIRRLCHTVASQPPLLPILCNRNPRNLERLCIAHKPIGYGLNKPGEVNFWHKLELTESNRYVTAKVIHYQNGSVVEASTAEWSLKKQLYRTKDTCAFTNLAQVFARRCLYFGITEMACFIEATPGSKVDKFLNGLIDNGIRLEEPMKYINPQPWRRLRPEKPWDVIEK